MWNRKYDFQPGTKASSGQVDEEFNNLIEAVNALEEADKAFETPTGAQTKATTAKNEAITQVQALLNEAGWGVSTATLYNGDVNAITKSGVYAIDPTATNKPGTSGGVLFHAIGNEPIQLFIEKTKLSYRVKSTDWQPWVKLGTPEDEMNATLQNGWVNAYTDQKAR